jgi:hypothetical protein
MAIPLVAAGLRALLAAGEPILAAGGRMAGAVGKRIAADPLTGALVKGGTQVAEAAAPVIEAATPYAKAGMAALGEGATMAANAGRQFAGGAMGAADAAGAGLPYAAGQAVRQGAQAVGEVGKEAMAWSKANPVKSLAASAAAPFVVDAFHTSPQEAMSSQNARQVAEAGKMAGPAAEVAATVHDLNKRVFSVSQDYGHYEELMNSAMKHQGKQFKTSAMLTKREYDTIKKNPTMAAKFAQG